MLRDDPQQSLADLAQPGAADGLLLQEAAALHLGPDDLLPHQALGCRDPVYRGVDPEQPGEAGGLVVPDDGDDGLVQPGVEAVTNCGQPRLHLRYKPALLHLPGREVELVDISSDPLGCGVLVTLTSHYNS